jgi:hypothetical protein
MNLEYMDNVQEYIVVVIIYYQLDYMIVQVVHLLNVIVQNVRWTDASVALYKQLRDKSGETEALEN